MATPIMTTSAEFKDAVFALMRRYNQLGQLLPVQDEFDTSDAAARAEAKVVIAEMHKTMAEIDAVLNEQAATPRL